VEETHLATGDGGDRASPGEPFDRWGPFERLQRVGHGAFGEVYRAFDPTLQRHVALKLLLPRGADPEADAGELLREARALAKLRHPNVVAIYGVDRHDGRVGFWSDFVFGRTLSQLVDSQGPFGPPEAALIAIDVCKAAAAVHAAGLLHRDIKAGNVMREAGGRILLMDFGLSHDGYRAVSSSGTPAYMAPEVLAGRPATIASDIYAIGVLMFFLLTGRHPVAGANFEELCRAHAAGARRNLLDLRPDVPERLARVVDTATNPDPGQRFATAGQMIAAVSDAIGMSASPIEPRPRTLRHIVFWTAPVVAAVLLLMAVPQVRRMMRPAAAVQTPLGGEAENYRQAHDLIAHYYRPHALETAILLLQQIIAADERFAPAHADLGRANYLQFVQLREPTFVNPAREESLRALALAPDLASPHVTLGLLYAQNGQNDAAAHEIETALQLDRFNAAAHAALADLYERQGRASLVEPTLKKAVSLAPDDWSLVNKLGEYYLNKSQWREAGDQYRRAVELTPDNPRAQNNLGLVFRGLGRLEDAAAAFREAIALEPTALRYRNLGMVLAESGDYVESVRMLQQSIQMRPSQYRAWGILALVYLNQHEDANKVRDTFQKAIDLAAPLRKETPTDSYLLADVGMYYAFLKMEKESLPLLAQAAALGPDTPEVLYQVAVGYEALGRREDAVQSLASAHAGGYPVDAIERNPQLAGLRADPRYRATGAGSR